MTVTPKFHPNLWGDLQGKLDVSVWESSTTAWQENRYRDAFNLLLDYISPSLRTTYGNPTQTEFNVPHGSVVVNISLNENSVEVNCPVVDISNAVRIPLLRKVAELNFHPLSLAQLKLHTNQLSFYYSSTLDTAEPTKTYYVLKEICQIADWYDDEFREKFKATNLVEPKVKHKTEAELEKAWNELNEIINESFEFQKEFDSQRWFGASIGILSLAIQRIELCIQVQGYLKNELERIMGSLNNGNLNVTDRIQTAHKFLAQLQQAGKEAFAKNIYEAETFIPEKWRTSAGQLKGMVEGNFETARSYYDQQNYFAVCMESLTCIYGLFYRNNMDSMVNSILFDVLTRSSAKAWQEASGTLLSGLQTLMTLR